MCKAAELSIGLEVVPLSDLSLEEDVSREAPGHYLLRIVTSPVSKCIMSVPIGDTLSQAFRCVDGKAGRQRCANWEFFRSGA